MSYLRLSLVLLVGLAVAGCESDETRTRSLGRGDKRVIRGPVERGSTEAELASAEPAHALVVAELPNRPGETTIIRTVADPIVRPGTAGAGGTTPAGIPPSEIELKPGRISIPTTAPTTRPATSGPATRPE